MNINATGLRFCKKCGEQIVGETVFWNAADGPWHARCMPKAHEHRFEDRGFANLPGTPLGVFWWECECGVFVWHQKGIIERGILWEHFMDKEDAPKEFDLNA